MYTTDVQQLATAVTTTAAAFAMYQLLCHVKVPASNGHLPNAASGQQNVGFYPC